MHRYMDLLLGAWRETCRSPDLREVVPSVVRLVGDQLPLNGIIVWRLDLERRRLLCVAAAAVEPRTEPAPAARGCSDDELRRLLQWITAGEPAHLPCGTDDRRRAFVTPPEVDGDVLAGPLRSPDDVSGFLVLAAAAGDRFSEVHRKVVRGLLEPFSAALANDARFRAIKEDSRSAEADRRSLLTKLGRAAISEEIVGADSGLRPVMERVAQVSRSDLPVLILGETGSGKEVIARAIHGSSRRASGPFLRVNCGAIPPGLVDSELFGHERGSFTDAVTLRKGWFERADGGTLFLDEIGELPAAAQVRLLRILQDGTFERVGGQRSLTVDVRVVAATNRDLGAMVASGEFRDDLWYRLAVFPIRVPALRDRPQDMPALAAHVADRAARRFGLPRLAPTRDQIDVLLAYDWPGNVRELQAVIDRAAILGDGERLEIGKALGVGERAERGSASGRQPAGITTEVFPTLDQAMTEHIEAALTLTRGRIEGPEGAALLLDINPHTLRARMRKLGIDWTRFRGGGLPRRP